jgi:hypothetical protein
MTFQVALVGSDGVLLASDRRYTRQDTCRSSFQSDKIFVSPKGDISCCSAGDEIAEEVGVEFLKMLSADGTDVEFRGRLESMARSTIAARRSYARGMLLLVRNGPSGPGLWSVTVSIDETMPGREIARPISDKFCQGDKANSASFFGEAYFPKKHATVPIANMRTLAAHAVLMAGKTNPCYIEGLEIVECRKDGFTKLPPKEIADLAERSAKIDSDLAAKMLNGSLA